MSQSEKSLGTLIFIKKYFDCGLIIRNKRYDNHHADMFKYCVRSIKDIKGKIIPFFSNNKLKSAKINDFKIFVKIVREIENGNNLKMRGLQKIAKLSLQMNRKSRPKFFELLRD